MKKQILAIAIGATLALPLMAQAEGFYVGGNVGSAKHKLSDSQESINENDTGYKVYGGIAINKYFGAELGYADFGSYTESDSSGSYEASAKSTYLAATGTYTITQQFSIFGKVGVAFNKAKYSVTGSGFSASASGDNTNLLLGIGAAYAFTPNMSVVAEYEDFGKVDKLDGAEYKVNMLSVGLRYKF